jgi:hypothetical protein
MHSGTETYSLSIFSTLAGRQAVVDRNKLTPVSPGRLYDRKI